MSMQRHEIPKMCAAIKPASMSVWHQRAGHLNDKDLAKLPESAGVVFFGDKPSFCEACALGK
jgi:hypothetical protein